jgi:hypothetical protein
VTADDQGEFSATIDPPGAAAGEHTITADPAEGDAATATLTCVGAAVAFTGPRTNVSLGVIVLVALVVTGVGALVAGRRRARRAA